MAVVQWLRRVVARSPAKPVVDQAIVAPSTFEDQLAWAEEVLGSSVTTTDRSWPHNRSMVVELQDADGGRWFLKRPGIGLRFEREVYAYEHFLSVLGDRVPRYMASNARHQTLLIGAVPGQLANDGDHAAKPDVQRQAGELLARLHGSAPPQPAPGIGEQVTGHTEALLDRADGVLEPSVIDFVRRANSAFADLNDAVTVPCHRDYWGRNWVVDEDGVLRVIDFGLSGWDFLVRDFSRLAQYTWSSSAYLKDAFFDGYGRHLNAVEQQQLHGYLARSVVRTILRAHDGGNVRAEERLRRQLSRLVAADFS